MTGPIVIPLVASLDLELTPRSREVMESLQRMLGPRFVAQEPAAAPQAAPAIGQPWPGMAGTYTGISRGENGEPDAHLVWLDVESDRPLNWRDGMAWAASLGDGVRLPTQREAALLRANVPELARKDRPYWTCTQYDAHDAWSQDFYLGNQGLDFLSYEAWCRPLRRLPL